MGFSTGRGRECTVTIRSRQPIAAPAAADQASITDISGASNGPWIQNEAGCPLLIRSSVKTRHQWHRWGPSPTHHADGKQRSACPQPTANQHSVKADKKCWPADAVRARRRLSASWREHLTWEAMGTHLPTVWFGRAAEAWNCFYQPCTLWPKCDSYAYGCW